MLLTEEEKEAMMNFAKRQLRSKEDEWWARDFLGGWREYAEDL